MLFGHCIIHLNLIALVKNKNIRDTCAVLVALGVALVVSRVVASRVFPLFDDSFITMRYARNLASGFGFVYNVHERVLADTCPAFGLLLSGFFLVGLPMPATLIELNILCDVGILFLTLIMLSNKELRAEAMLFAILFALDPALSRICVGGMEMDLFLLCSLVAIYCYHTKRKYLAITIASLTYFLRPEAILLVCTLCVLEFFARRRTDAVLLGVVALAIVSIPLLAIQNYYGTIIPQSVIAKSHWAPVSYLESIKGLMLNDAVEVALLPFMLWGVWSSRKHTGMIRTIGIWSLLYIVVYGVRRVFVFTWYGESVHYAEMLFSALGIADILRRVAPQILRLFASKRAVVLQACSVIVIAICAQYAVGNSKITSKVYAPLERWCQTHNLSHATFLASDIGALGYYANQYIYDSDGLTWPEALAFPSYLEIVHRTKPDYVFLSATRPRCLLFIDNPELAMLYKPIAYFARDSITLDSTLPEAWRQDYVLFGKRAN
jgi:hypothetical protein